MTIRELLPLPASRRPLCCRLLGRPALALRLGAGLAFLLALSAELHADEALEAAKKRYEAGERDYLAGRYWQSAKAFEEAFAMSRRGDLLFNAGRAYERGEYTVRAIEAYQAYLDAVSEAPDKEQIRKRIAELRASLAKLHVVTSEQGFLFVDGHEYGRTPMQKPIDLDSGYHRVEVRSGSRLWAREQQFSSGQSYKFEAELAAAPSGRGLADTTTGDEERPKQRTRRLAVSLGLGGAFDVAGHSFPPHQASLYAGVDYRVVERAYFAFDFGLRLPVEVAQGWRNAGFLLAGRGAWSPVPRRPLELVFELDLGLGVLDNTASAPFSAMGACDRPSQLASCTLYGLRLHPKLAAAYRVTPVLELRGELLGVEVNLTNPIVDPRITVDVAAAYRFF